MIRIRSIRYDLALLSDGFFQYWLLYCFGFAAIAFALDAWPAAETNSLIVLFPMTLCAITHITSEKSDKVSDRIVLELGGYRRRITIRVLTVTISNILLAVAGFIYLGAIRYDRVNFTPALVFGVATVILVFSIAGTIVSAALPHPFVAASLMSLLALLGGSNPEQNLTMRSISAITHATTVQSWFSAAAWVFIPWAIAAALLFPAATGRVQLTLPKVAVARSTRALRVPRWSDTRSSFLKVTFWAGATNSLVLVATLVALAMYTGSSLQIAAKIADLHVGKDFYYLFPGQIMLNLLPALTLASSIENQDQYDQERFFYKSAKASTIAQVLRMSAAATIGAFVVTSTVVAIAGIKLEPIILLRTFALETILIPGLALSALHIRKAVKVPVFMTAISFASTFIEVVVSKLAPELRPWLPSSLFSAAAGGAGLYVTSPNQIPPIGWALGFVILVGLGPLFWAFWPKRKMS
jgi:hypothetical protein